MSRYQRMHNALSAALNPDTLMIEDESHKHHVPVGSESHFKIIAVASCFNTLNRVARYRMVHTTLAEELSQGLHALSLHLYTPDEWLARTSNVRESPNCRNGKHPK